jgi:hypothetical protein
MACCLCFLFSVVETEINTVHIVFNFLIIILVIVVVVVAVAAIRKIFII